DNPELNLGDNAEMKKEVLRAWAYWWKGFIYSRIGSLYSAGIINDTYEETNNDFKTHDEIINEANKNFDKAIEILGGVSNTESYKTFLTRLIPSFTMVGTGGVLSPDEWKRSINTYKARNILVGKYGSELSGTDLQAILNFAEDGVKKGDKIFTNRSALANDLVSETAWQPYRALAGWMHISERLIQEYYAGDKRFDRNYRIPPQGYYQLNPQGRGWQYGTRYTMNSIEQGGDYASTVAGSAEMPVGGSYEENELMLAEVKIRNGNIQAGFKHIDNVREYQDAGLEKLEGVNMTNEEAIEVLRRERRVGLLNKNVAFYDARRFGFLKPVADGGGRKNANLFYQRSGANAALETGVTIDYNYLEWWDVPVNELDFNAPRQGSAVTVSN
ncbi:RagB/SusD family nutrient uptake outer membrane protein, partial [Alcaligenes nematophilus]|uniref:RagB/SusD family nutrient uptake outer membrane protein n=1 Tax=Alcaligenes nematophilus TaxID=2994643 RepID=UPI003D1E40E3